MNAPGKWLQRLTICLALGTVIIVQLLVPTNPDGTLPAVPELAGIALLGGILGVVLMGRTLQLPGWSFRQNEVMLLSLVWLTVLGVTGPRALVSLFHTPSQVWTPCWSLPGKALKLECFFQATIFQNYGYRTFFMLLTATLLGTLACLISRSVRQGWKLLLATVVFGPLLVTVVSFFCLAFGIEQALPRSLLHNDWGQARLSQIFANPGWVWPYFAPGLAIVLWATTAASTWTNRILFAGMAAVITLGILATQQAGGLLLCLVYVVVYGFYYLTLDFKKRKRLKRVVGTTLLFCLVSALYLIFSNQALLQELAQLFGYQWKAEALSPETTRWEIWKAAWELFGQTPLFGHGYASWFQMIFAYGQKTSSPDIVFDTAHNFFVQMLAELGLLHTGLILSLLVLMAWVACQNARFLPARKLLLLLAASSFLVPALVQEIDYIRPTFYIHAIFWGTLVGLPFYQNNQQERSPTQKPDASPQPHWLSGYRRFIPSLGFGLLSGAAGLGILFCLLNFSLGGYSFHAQLTQPNTQVTRWLGPSVSLASFATAEGKAYSVYDVTPFQKPMSVQFKGAKGFRITGEGKDELWLALENGSGALPKRHNLALTPAYADSSRWITAQISYPARQSNLGISWSRNMYPWENFANRTGRWCTQDCLFLARSCGRSDHLDFAIQAPRPDYSAAQPLAFKVSVYGLAKGSEFSSSILQNLPKAIAQRSMQLEQPGAEKRMQVAGTAETAWYLVHIQTESGFNPKSQGLSEDNRDLGLIVSDVDCRE